MWTAILIAQLAAGHAPNASGMLAEVLASHEPSSLAYQWLTPAELKDNRVAFEAARDRCEWQPARDVFYKFKEGTAKFVEYWVGDYVPEFLTLTSMSEAETMENFEMWNPPPEMRLRSLGCETAAASKHATWETWRVERLGPAEGHGGYDWHFFGGADLFGFSSLLEAHDTIWITALSLYPIDAEGRMLGYPPLHLHHSHLGPCTPPVTGPAIFSTPRVPS